MALEQTVKDLQTQNAQFQQMIMALAKGQEELKALIVKEKTKKPKKPAGMVNLPLNLYCGCFTGVIH